MKGNTVLVTGSTSGIGLAIAREFARAGYNIGFHGLESDGASIAAAIAEEFNIKFFFSAANLTQPPEINSMIKEAVATLGAIDILVNNAGIQHVSPVVDFPLEKWNELISVNLTACFCTSQAVWAGMKDKKWGRIINISSAHGLVASENKSAYVASKHGLIGLTKVLALEGAEFGITANAICPGFVKTPLVDNQISDLSTSLQLSEDEIIRNVILEKHAVKEFVGKDSIASLALFLASDNAAMITGASLPIDGGWTVR